MVVNLSWGKAHIMMEALLLLALTWIYSIYLARTTYFLGVFFLVLAFISITVIYVDHFVMFDQETKARTGARRRRGKGKASKIPANGPAQARSGGAKRRKKGSKARHRPSEA